MPVRRRGEQIWDDAADGPQAGKKSQCIGITAADINIGRGRRCSGKWKGGKRRRGRKTRSCIRPWESGTNGKVSLVLAMG